jgi:hypothetical protein
MITQAELKKHLHYDPTTGVFTRLIHQRRSAAGSVVGDIKSAGYRYIGVCKCRYRAHRLAWLYMTGAFPTFQIDHDDGDRDNNRWKNLNAADNTSNGRNQRLRSNNTSGICGVYWRDDLNAWVGKICVDGETIHLGVFSNKAECAAARKHAEIIYGFHPNHGSHRQRYCDV